YTPHPARMIANFFIIFRFLNSISRREAFISPKIPNFVHLSSHLIRKHYFYAENIEEMCGRFSLTSNEHQLNIAFELSGGTAPYVPRYNGAPTQQLAVIPNDDPGQLHYYRWGLIP